MAGRVGPRGPPRPPRPGDTLGELASLSATEGSSSLLAIAFTYDVLGRIVSKTDDGISWTYGYDLAGRLADVKKNGQAFATYTYDANGNRLTGGATYDEEDRQLTGGGASFTYTPNGERKTRVDAAGTTTYGYDGRGHLVSVQLPTGKRVAYGLDARGRRVSRSENGVVSHRWLFRGQLQPVAEVDAAGEVTTRYVYGTRVNVPDYFVRGGTRYAVLTDHLGSVRKVVDAASGEVLQELEYDPWGVVTKNTSPGFQPFGFAGGVWDGVTGLVHFGAREYEPGTGRWVERDPIGFRGGDPGLYGYVGGGPVYHVDPLGLWIVNLGGQGGAAVGLGYGLGANVGLGLYFGWDSGPRLGVYATEGHALNTPVARGTGFVIGRSVGASLTCGWTDSLSNFKDAGEEMGLDLDDTPAGSLGGALNLDAKTGAFHGLSGSWAPQWMGTGMNAHQYTTWTETGDVWP